VQGSSPGHEPSRHDGSREQRARSKGDALAPRTSSGHSTQRARTRAARPHRGGGKDKKTAPERSGDPALEPPRVAPHDGATMSREGLRPPETTGSGYALPVFPYRRPAELAGERRRHKVAVVGGGLAGLTAACDLASRGIPEVDRVSFSIHTMRRKEIQLQNVRRQNQCMASAIELVSSGAINLDQIVTHHFSLAETKQAFDLVADYRDGVVKAIVHVAE
jgi:hypothetical protein